GNNPEDLGHKLYENLESIATRKLIHQDPTLSFTDDAGVARHFYRIAQTLDGLLFVVGQPTNTLVNIAYMASKRQLGVSHHAVAGLFVLLGEELNLFDRSLGLEILCDRLRQTKSYKLNSALKRVDSSLRSVIETVRNPSTMEITTRYVKNPELLAKLQLITLLVGIYYTMRNPEEQKHGNIVN
ncbi:MAG: hypothetical protein NZT61_07290, partial [Deltaproteobacteria bacterium]|nr:hypothetical protein [Deltaproteobacteria bacterium]